MKDKKNEATKEATTKKSVRTTGEKTTKPATKTTKPAYTRMQSVAEVLKQNPKLTRDEAVKQSDVLYAKRTGAKSNIKEATFCYNYAIKVLQVFNFVS